MRLKLTVLALAAVTAVVHAGSAAQNLNPPYWGQFPSADRVRAELPAARISGNTVTVSDTGFKAVTIWNLKIAAKAGPNVVTLTRDNAASDPYPKR